MEQLINRRLVYPRKQLISHLQQGPTQEHQSAALQPQWLQTHSWAERWASRHWLHTSYWQPDSDRRRKESSVAQRGLKIGSARQKLNTGEKHNKNTGVNRNRTAESMNSPVPSIQPSTLEETSWFIEQIDRFSVSSCNRGRYSSRWLAFNWQTCKRCSYNSNMQSSQLRVSHSK